ncbi:CusA/CzcA family heavy metal efflux RND transporter [Neiella marina]|uniref:CusA/CzcA family heavy metal efflux RND transporter n=1 Tax=Neiella holothuriorum TaxID=2870530 RepID=A0ABS7EKI7_9GAMM|nr:CusA/CzcA family heavy metal efflux RND transporter [Neiella holothuriorum]MBW8192868.1 CusA/CzcA family heavy metal efflux RND transporter [Neiella holothuriorum]
MINHIIRASLQHRLLVVGLFTLIAAIGYRAMITTPLDALPDLSDVQVIVKTSYPGQSPQLVEDQITYPLSSAMLAVPGARTVRSFSMFGDSFVYVIFEDGTDIYWARSRVLESLAQLQGQLPDDVTPVLGPDASGVGWVYQYALVDRSGKHDLAELTSLQDWFIKQRLQSVSGVSEVATVGGMKNAFQVILKPQLLAAHQLDLAQVKQAIQAANGAVGGSVIEMAEAEYMVTSSGYLQSLADFAAIPIGIRTEAGVPLMLSDIATIRRGPVARRGIAELDGEGEVVGGIVVMRYGQNALETIANIKQELQQIEAGLPDGVTLQVTYDRAELIENSVDNLTRKVLEEILAVVIICGLFLLHARSTLVAVVSLPLAILMSFLLMRGLGISANIMSLGGIAIAIGALVDAAIVMVENGHKHLEAFRQQQGVEPSSQQRWQIVSKACQEVGPALFFSLLIITVSFAPVFALEAQEGRLFQPLAYTKTFAMAASAIIAITLIPVLMGYLLRGRIIAERANPISRLLIAIYRPALQWVLRFPKLTIVVALLILAGAFVPASKLGYEFMPDLEEGDLLYMPTTLPSVSAAKAGQILQQTDRLIKTVPEVQRVFGKVGRAETATDPAPLTMLETTIQLKPKSQWREGLSLDDVIAELEQRVQVPGMTNAWVQPIKTRIDMLSTGVRTPVGIKISGRDVVELERLGSEIETLMSDLPGVRSAFAQRSGAGRYLDIAPNRLAAARYGMTLEDVQQVVQIAIGGMTIDESIQGQERYPINMRYPRAWRDDIERLKVLPVITPDGHYVALQQLADVAIADGPPMLSSENGQLISWVFIDLDNSISVGEFIDIASPQLTQAINLPPRYGVSFAGQYEYMERVSERLTWLVPIVLGVIFMLLLMTFNSLLQASVILLSLPFAMVGSIWLLWWLDYNMSVAVVVGLIALAGVAAEFGVVMQVYLNQSLRELSDKQQVTEQDVQQALIKGAVSRIRPKAMTVATIFFGLLPIMWGAGVGNEVMQKIAAPMVGGMVTAPLLSLFVIPAIYLLVYRRR